MAAKPSRRRFVAQAIGLGAAATGCNVARLIPRPRRQQPNIVLILADDLGYGDLGCYGAPDTLTPVIDQLAGEGVRFTSFYSNGPECTPTRTALLTGRYQHRVGGLECAIGVDNVGRYDDAIRLAEKRDLGLPVRETSIARMLKRAGYQTAIYGKWHLGYELKFFPRRHGFDDFFGPLGGTVDYFYYTEPTLKHMLYRNEIQAHPKGYLTDLITREAVDFVGRQDGRAPFFLYVPYTAPHTPYQGPNDRMPRPLTQDEWNKGTRRTFSEMVERMDRGIGQILKALDEKDFSDNTVVIFASDNGANKMGRNAPYSGNKGGLFEGGIRVPCIARWPGRLPRGGVCEQPCMTMDLSASIVRIAGAPQSRPFDGIDILREAEMGAAPQKRTLFWRARRGERTWKAVRDGMMKYISRRDGDKVQEYLFNLKRDPGEQDNLIEEFPDEAARLKKVLAEWEREVQHTR